jgi:hypothetical protein
MRYVQKERLPHPLTPFPKPLGMTRGTKSPGLAGKRQKMLSPCRRRSEGSQKRRRWRRTGNG